VLRTRSPLGLQEQAPWTPFDLHVLSTPPAFVLSQDQTLQRKPAEHLAVAGSSVDWLSSAMSEWNRSSIAI
jgi:hypothetical protein